MLKKLWMVALWLGVVVLLFGCGGGGGGGSSSGTGPLPGGTIPSATPTPTPAPTPSRTLTAIQVTAPAPQVPSGRPLQLTATGTFSDGSHQNVSGSVSWTSGTPGVASVSNASGSRGLLVGTAPGQTTVSAVDPATGISGPLSIQVTQATLVVLGVTPLRATLAAGLQQQLAAIGVFSDHTVLDLSSSVTWTSSGPASVDGTGLVTGTAAGSATVTATDPISQLHGTSSITVTSASIVSLSVNPPSPSIPKGRQQAFTATAQLSDHTSADVTTQVTWSSSNTASAVVSNSGLATAVATTPDVSIVATDPVTQRQGSATLSVTSAVLVSLSVQAGVGTVAVGRTLPLKAIATFSDSSIQDVTGSVTWSSLNGSTATVGVATGVVQGLKSGTATIQIVDPSTQVKTTVPIQVTAASLASIHIAGGTASLPLGATASFAAVGTFSDNSTEDLTSQVAWTSSAAAAVSVSNAVGSQGQAIGVSIGGATLTATDPLSGITGQTSVQVVSGGLGSLVLTPTNPTVAKGRTVQFRALGTFGNGTQLDLTSSVQWTSQSPLVVSVNGTGLATALATSGTSLVTATDPSSHVSASTTVTASGATLQSLSITPANPSVAPGGTSPLTATGLFSDGSTQDETALVVWTTSASSVIAVGNLAGTHGVLFGIGKGQATITATDVTSGVTVSTLVQSTSHALVSLTVTPVNPHADVATAVQFTATATFVDGTSQDVTAQVHWFSTDPGIITLSNGSGTAGLGSVLGLNGQVTTVTASDPVTGIVGSTGFSIGIIGRFVYTANEGGNSVSGFTLNPFGGLAAVQGVSFQAGASPMCVTVDNSGHFVYCANSGDSSITEYRIDVVTGNLQTLGTFSLAEAPLQMVTSPATGNLLAVLTTTHVSILHIDPASGLLSNTPATTSLGSGPQCLAYDASGQFLYVGNDVTQTISGFNVTTGSLVAIANSTVSMPLPLQLAPEATGAALLAVGGSSPSGAVRSFSIDAGTGGLTLQSNVAETDNFCLAVDPLSTFVITDRPFQEAAVLGLDPSGNLTLNDSAPASEIFAQAMTIEVSGQFLMTVVEGNTVESARFDRVPPFTPLIFGGNTVPTGAGPVSIISTP